MLLPLIVNARTGVMYNHKNTEKLLLSQSCSHSSSVTKHLPGIWMKQSNAAKKAIGFML